MPFISKLIKSYLLIHRFRKLRKKELKKLQDKAFRKIVKQAFTVPFYRKKYKKVGIHPDDIKKLEDIEKLPYITKDELRKNHLQEITPLNKNKLISISTSGTLGKPLHLFADIETILVGLAGYIRVMKEHGFGLRDKISIIVDLSENSAEKIFLQHLPFKKFLKNLKFYYTRDELYRIGMQHRYYYNNLCENAMGQVKRLAKKMGGFKNLRATQSYINVLWYDKIKPLLKEEENQPKKKENSDFNPTLQIFIESHKINLEEISRDIEIDMQLLIKEAERLNLKVIGKYAFKREFLEKKHVELMLKKPKTVGEAAKILNLDVETTQLVLHEIGIKTIFTDIYVNNAKLTYTNIQTNLKYFLVSGLE